MPDPYWAARVARILQSPINEQQNGETRLYTCDETITFSGGAFTTDGVTAVRPASGEDDSRRSVWRREDDELVLADGRGTEHARISTDVEGISKQHFPAIYSYDYDTDEYVVYDHGETFSYETKAAFEAEWVPIRRPFVPEHELPVPDYESASYAIVILPDSEDADPVVYRDETTTPLQTLLDDPPVPATKAADVESTGADGKTAENGRDDPTTEDETDRDATAPTSTSTETGSGETVADTASSDESENGDESESSPEPPTTGDPDAGIAAFAAARVVEAEETEIIFDVIYTAYLEYARAHGFETRNRSQFSRQLKNHHQFTTKRKRLDGDQYRWCIGLAFVDEHSAEQTTEQSPGTKDDQAAGASISEEIEPADQKLSPEDEPDQEEEDDAA